MKALRRGPHRRTWAAAGIAAALLAGTAAAAAAQTERAAAPSAYVPVERDVLIVNQVTGTYLVGDDLQGKAGTYLQVFGHKLSKDQSNVFRLHRVGGTSADPQYQLTSVPPASANAKEACATDENGVNQWVYLRECQEKNKDQRWHLRRVRGTEANDPGWALVPDRDESLALRADNTNLDAEVHLATMWGDEPSFLQSWRIVPAA